MRADEKLTAFVELEAAIRGSAFALTIWRHFITLGADTNAWIDMNYNRVIYSLIFVVLISPIARGDALKKGDALKEGDRCPIDPYPKGSANVLIFIGEGMTEWFNKNLLKQAGVLDKRFSRDKVRVIVFYLKYPKNLDKETPEAIRLVAEESDVPFQGFSWQLAFEKMGFEGIPQMLVVDAKGIIRKHQDGWTGHESESRYDGNTWLADVASDALDSMGMKRKPR